MIQDLRDLLAQVSTPGDTATVLLAGSAGFMVDAGLNVIGFCPQGRLVLRSQVWHWALRRAGKQGGQLASDRRMPRQLRTVHMLYWSFCRSSIEIPASQLRSSRNWNSTAGESSMMQLWMLPLSPFFTGYISSGTRGTMNKPAPPRTSDVSG